MIGLYIGIHTFTRAKDLLNWSAEFRIKETFWTSEVLKAVLYRPYVLCFS